MGDKKLYFLSLIFFLIPHKKLQIVLFVVQKVVEVLWMATPDNYLDEKVESSIFVNKIGEQFIISFLLWRDDWLEL